MNLTVEVLLKELEKIKEKHGGDLLVYIHDNEGEQTPARLEFMEVIPAEKETFYNPALPKRLTIG